MQYVLFEDKTALAFLPLTYLRPVYHLRLGVDRVIDKWSRKLGKEVKGMAFDHLKNEFSNFEPSDDTIFINGKILPEDHFINEHIKTLAVNQGFYGRDNEILAFRTQANMLTSVDNYIELSHMPLNISFYEYGKSDGLRMLRRSTDLFRMNGEQLRIDIKEIKQSRPSAGLKDLHTAVYGEENIFIEPGAKIKAAVLNAQDGPIYIGKNAVISEGAIISGAHAICEGAVVQMGAKLRGDSTIGPRCKVGGEISNSVFQGYANKSHDGFMGNSVIGEWCNIGAGTNVSNLKNNYGSVRVFDYREEELVDSKLQFCGLLMGDYSRCGIGTMFNTGTVVGVCANIFGAGFTQKFIPSFSWYDLNKFDTYDLEKAYETIEIMMKRRDIALEPEQRVRLLAAYEASKKFRFWEDV